jgi:hypothetical protein
VTTEGEIFIENDGEGDDGEEATGETRGIVSIKWIQ